MDVICPKHDPIYGVRGDLFLLDLDSEAFAIGNDLVVVHGSANEDDSWLGDFKVITKSVFAAADLTDMMSLMVFGVPRDKGIHKLYAFLEAGSTRTGVRCCFVCARSTKREKQYHPWPSKLRRTPKLDYETKTLVSK
jgi:hypothetical protein